jgi:chain length determinant protein EpsF
MNAQQFLLIVWARRRIVLAVFLLTAVIGTAVTLLMPKQYIASVSIVVDVKADPIAGMVLPAVASPSYMATQTEIIQSERVAGRVVKMLQLEKSPPALASWKDATDGKVPFEHYYGNLLLRGLAVKPSRGSNIIGISFAGLDPQFAAAVANAFAQAYIDTSIDLRVDPARQYAAWFDERMKSLRGNLEKAQAKLSSFQQEKGIVASDVRLDEEIAKLAALTSQLSSVQGQKVETATRQKNTGSEYSPDVMQNPLIQGLKSSLAQAEAKLNEISSIVGANHPQRQALEAQIQGLKTQLRDEIKRISSGAATASRVSSQQEAELKAMIEVQKKRVLDLRSGHDEIFVLVQDVETAQRAYEAVAKRVTELSLESKSEQTNLSVLSPAVAPSDPAKPNLLKNILAALGGGLLLGIIAAVGIESLDRRVRNAGDLELDDAVPVLGVLRPDPLRMSMRERILLVWRFLRPWRRRSLATGAA